MGKFVSIRNFAFSLMAILMTTLIARAENEESAPLLQVIYLTRFESLEVEAVDGWYSFDVDYAQWFFLRPETTKDWYVLNFKPKQLNGKPITPVKKWDNGYQNLSVIPWFGDYHIDVDTALTVAYAYALSPLIKEHHTLTANLLTKSPDVRYYKSYFKKRFENHGGYQYSCTFLGDERIKSGSTLVIGGPTADDPSISIEYTYGFVCDDIFDDPEHEYTFTALSRDGQTLYDTDKTLKFEEDFEGTVTVSHNGDYFTPMKVKFTPSEISGTSELISDTEESSVRYYNLQGIEVDTPDTGLFIEMRQGKSRLVRNP